VRKPGISIQDLREEFGESIASDDAGGGILQVGLFAGGGRR